jgi:hypothetical protein
VIKLNILSLKSICEKESYDLFDKYIRKLPRKSDGSYDLSTGEFYDNDVDAIRHAYTAGIFTQEYGEIVTEILGDMNELVPFGGNSSSNSPNSKNMDLWNNRIGRKLGLKTSGKLKLFKLILKALKNGELIIDPENDLRVNQALSTKVQTKNKVFVVKESKKGKNLTYFDFEKLVILSKDEFISEIKIGNYPFYEIRIVKGDETPVSKKDKNIPNNLG